MLSDHGVDISVWDALDFIFFIKKNEVNFFVLECMQQNLHFWFKCQVGSTRIWFITIDKIGWDILSVSLGIIYRYADYWFFPFRQYGTRESKEVAMEGRVQFDLLQVMLNLFCLLQSNLFFYVHFT